MEAKPSVLLVDDEFGPREALRMIFKERYAVETAADGAAALRALHGQTYDLLILDLHLGEGPSGLEILRALRQRGIETPALLVSGSTRTVEIGTALAAGGTSFVHKPFARDEILGAADAALPAETRERRERVRQAELLAEVGHEFRTPLAAILGYSEILGDPAAGELNDAQREALERIQLNTTRLIGYLEGLSNLLDRLVPERPERAARGAAAGGPHHGAD